MAVLGRRLFRLIRVHRGQFLAVAAVMAAGIAVYVSMSTALNNLSLSRDRFYRQCEFADYYFHLVRAPEQVVGAVASVPGVPRATGRIQKEANLFTPDGRKVQVRLTSYPLPMEGQVNRLVPVSGRLFEARPRSGGVEVMLDPQFAAANRLEPGSTAHLVAGGRRVQVNVVGTAISPEFVYVLKDPAGLMPDPENFGVLMIPQNQAQSVLGLPGGINQVLVTLEPWAAGEEVEEKIRDLLAPYGLLTSYPRDRQLSHLVLEAELDGLRASSRALPAIFLILAAAVQMVVLGRMVRAQRTLIGTMKGLGYGNAEILAHYCGYALVVAAAGAAAGGLLGVALASAISEAYARYFNLPQAIGGVSFPALVYGSVLSLAVGGAAGLGGARGVVSINPARAMRAQPPAAGGRVFLERWRGLWRRFDPAWRLAVRGALRRKGRLALELSGVMFAAGLLVVALFFGDSLDYLLKKHFDEEIRYDYMIRLASPVRDYEMRNLERLPGVVAVEGVLEVPVRLHFRGRTEEELLVGLPSPTSLRAVMDADGRPLPVPSGGVLLDERTASKLGVRIGDEIEVETAAETAPPRRTALRVAGLTRQFIGGGSYSSLEEAGRVLGERNVISGAMLKAAPGYEAVLEDELKRMDAVLSVSGRQRELRSFYENMGALIYFTAIMTVFSFILGFAIVYSFAAVGMAERTAELGLLRALGFSLKEISGLMWRETALRAAGGIALGLPFGRALAGLYLNSAGTTDVYVMPVVIYPSTYFSAALVGAGFVVAAHFMSVRKLPRIDPVEALKCRD